LARFERKRLHTFVGEIAGKPEISHLSHSLGMHAFSVEVSSIFDLELGAEDDFFRSWLVSADCIQQFGEVYTRPSGKLGQLDGM